jgi:uncharacterized protein DUF4424
LNLQSAETRISNCCHPPIATALRSALAPSQPATTCFHALQRLNLMFPAMQCQAAGTLLTRSSCPCNAFLLLEHPRGHARILAMRSLRFFLLCSFVLMAVLRAPADDTLVTLGAGGLIPQKTSKIVMESEDLQISINQITVKYVFRNTSDHDVDATVAFPLPALEGNVVALSPINFPSKDPVNFMAFKVEVNGNRILPYVQVRAFKNGRDITARLRSMGLPVSVLDSKLQSDFFKLSGGLRTQLEKEELIVDEEYKGKGGNAEHYVWGFWDMQILYYWHQRFPAHSTVRVRHSYKPVVGGGFIAWNDDGEIETKPYCGTAETFKRIVALEKSLPTRKNSDAALWEREIQFILTTANNWSGPIRHFHLSVLLDRPDEIFVTCTQGLKRTSPTRYDLYLSNFHPKGDLNFLILQTPSNNSELPLNN